MYKKSRAKTADDAEDCVQASIPLLDLVLRQAHTYNKKESRRNWLPADALRNGTSTELRNYVPTIDLTCRARNRMRTISRLPFTALAPLSRKLVLLHSPNPIHPDLHRSRMICLYPG
ncbi:hypothetical protein PGT21_004131 [Puccinia graminis f. sp. tritici]|uniref:Uncharacterized protein n=1 Tax=Puccinia graminis f. sp. tritici TaxID=56615 RepID=A0A5B0QZL5_PUCGR|nr:hypothetical protein PGT21_004131 [Puccinia graminis f. sp. tritici]